MRKIAPAAFLLSGILVFGSLFMASPALADDDDQTSSSEMTPAPLQTQNPKVHSPKVPKEPKEPREHIKRRELEQKYGKEGRLSLPPLVIRPKRDTDEVSGSTAFEIDDEDDETPAGSATNGTDGLDLSGSANKATAGSSIAGTAGSSGSNATLGNASAGFIAVNPVAKDSVVTVKSGTMVNPHQNTAIDLSTVKFTKKTPADTFIQAAQVGLYAMAAGALALSLLAVSRAIRRK